MNCVKKVFVIKIGGELTSKPEVLNALSQEIAKLKQAGTQIVLVHGGGQQVNALEKRLGNSLNIINGRRVTDGETVESIKMVLAGKINIEILSALQCHGVSAVGLSGVDSNILNVQRRPIQKIMNPTTQEYQVIDYGFVGDILAVNPGLIWTLIENNFLPVIAPLAADKQGLIYNINADTVAAALAQALHAVQWVILTNIDGVHDHRGNTISQLTCEQARAFIVQGVITDGMIPKIEAIIAGIQAGVNAVHIINGFKPEKLASIVMGESLGTLVTNK